MTLTFNGATSHGSNSLDARRIAIGVNGDGRREVLGLAIGASEAETFWTPAWPI